MGKLQFPASSAVSLANKSHFQTKSGKSLCTWPTHPKIPAATAFKTTCTRCYSNKKQQGTQNPSISIQAQKELSLC